MTTPRPDGLTVHLPPLPLDLLAELSHVILAVLDRHHLAAEIEGHGGHLTVHVREEGR